MTSSLEKGLVPSFWSQTSWPMKLNRIQKRGRKEEGKWFFTSAALVKNRKSKIFGKSHSQAVCFLGSFFFKYLCFPPEWWWGVLAFQAELRPFGSLHVLIFCAPPPASFLLPKVSSKMRSTIPHWRCSVFRTSTLRWGHIPHCTATRHVERGRGGMVSGQGN